MVEYGGQGNGVKWKQSLFFLFPGAAFDAALGPALDGLLFVCGDTAAAALGGDLKIAGLEGLARWAGQTCHLSELVRRAENPMPGAALLERAKVTANLSPRTGALESTDSH